MTYCENFSECKPSRMTCGTTSCEPTGLEQLMGLEQLAYDAYPKYMKTTIESHLKSFSTDLYKVEYLEMLVIQINKIIKNNNHFKCVPFHFKLQNKRDSEIVKSKAMTFDYVEPNWEDLL